MIRNNKITLSVDCMGGDNSVDDIVGGVKQFCSENINDTLLLHGDKKALSRALDKYPEIKKSIFELTEKSFDNDIILDEINLGEVLMETISLETPDYPKKTGASINLTPTESMDKENPFSILGKLKK